MPGSKLHEELAGGSVPSCKVCAYLATLPAEQATEWQHEMALPISVIRHQAILTALRNRGLELEETSVRRHRRNHVAR